MTLYRGTNLNERDIALNNPSDMRNMTWWTPDIDQAKRYSDGGLLKAEVNLDDSLKGDFFYNDNMPSNRMNSWGIGKGTDENVYSLGNDFLKNNAQISRYTDNIPTNTFDINELEDGVGKFNINYTDGDIIRRSQKVKTEGSWMKEQYPNAKVSKGDDGIFQVYHEAPEERPIRFTNANIVNKTF